jgi:hypothetical protein
MQDNPDNQSIFDNVNFQKVSHVVLDVSPLMKKTLGRIQSRQEILCQLKRDQAILDERLTRQHSEPVSSLMEHHDNERIHRVRSHLPPLTSTVLLIEELCDEVEQSPTTSDFATTAHNHHIKSKPIVLGSISKSPVFSLERQLNGGDGTLPVNRLIIASPTTSSSERGSYAPSGNCYTPTSQRHIDPR